MKPTPAQLAIIHVLESAVLSALLTIVAGVYQLVATHGLDFPALGEFLGIVFLGALGMIYRTVLTNPNLAQAGNDTLNEVKALLEQTLPFLHTHSIPPQGGSVIASPAPTPQPAQPSPITPQFTLPQALPQFTAPVQVIQPPPQQ